MGTGWSQDETLESQQREEAGARSAPQAPAATRTPETIQAQAPAATRTPETIQEQAPAATRTPATTWTSTTPLSQAPATTRTPALKDGRSASPSQIHAPNASIDLKQPKLKNKPITSTTTATNQGIQIRLPHNCETIIKDSDTPIDQSSEKFYEQLYSGIFLNGKKKKYWIEKKGNYNCFFILPRDLHITWAEDKRYWNWENISETSNSSTSGSIAVAELMNVCWLEVAGKFNTSLLSPQVTYRVAYVIMIKEFAYGWEVPVNVRLTLPNGTKQEHKENVNEKPRGQWIQIRAGEFKANQENVGDIEFSMYEYEGGQWKTGLVIRGVTIVPVI